VVGVRRGSGAPSGLSPLRAMAAVMVTLEEARSLITLSEGKILPPVGSTVEIYQYPAMVLLALGGVITSIEYNESVFARLVILYQEISVFHYCSPNSSGNPRHLLLPTKLPPDCPATDVWPRWLSES